VEEEPKIEIPVKELHSSKEIRKDNKMKQLQNKEFGEGKGHEVQDINDNNKVVYKSRLRTKNEIKEKPKIGFNVGDKVKSEFIENGSKKWYSGKVLKVNTATYKVKFSEGQIVNMKKSEVLADDITTEPKPAVITPDNNKPEATNNKTLKVGDRVSILFDGKDWYNRTVSHINRGMQTVKYDNRDTDRHR
jgi:hypothetical protein